MKESKIDREEISEAMTEMLNNLDIHVGAVLMKTKLCRAYYMGLVKEGFTKKEALELCKNFTAAL